MNGLGRWAGAVVLLGLFGLTGLAGGCGRVSSSSGSNSNWLQTCETSADCASGLACWCGVCSAPCRQTTDCAGPASTCAPSADTGCQDASASAGQVCTAACRTRAQCAALGPGLDCLAGACVEARSVDTPDASPRVASGRGIVTSVSTACVLTLTETYCWGGDAYGQLGFLPATAADGNTPTVSPALSGVASLASGEEHGCAVTQQGDVLCWGKNDLGQVGSPSAPRETCPDYVLDKPGFYECQPTPTAVPGLGEAKQVAVVRGRSCALLVDGSVECWGNVASLDDWLATVPPAEQLALGEQGACVLTRGGGLHCSVEVPEALAARTDLVEVQLSSDGPPPDSSLGFGGFGCARSQEGEVTCWGDNRVGQLGAPEGEAAIDSGSIALSLGNAHACSLDAAGFLRCWGRNTNGESGRLPRSSPRCGRDTCEKEPALVVGLPPLQAVSVTSGRGCGLGKDGNVWCWGASGYLNTGRAEGAVTHVPGPWAAGTATCDALATTYEAALDDALARTDYRCRRNADCEDVSLSLGGSPRCAIRAVARASAAALRADLLDIEERLAPSTAAGACAPPGVECVADGAAPFCNAGTCERADDVRAGCDDRCDCEATRYALGNTYQGDCAGFNLAPSVTYTCLDCESPSLLVFVLNRGDAAFDGQAVISAEPFEPGSSTALLDAVTTTLHLEPGDVSPPIRLVPKEAGYAKVRVTAAGDCQPLDDASNTGELPPPEIKCE